MAERRGAFDSFVRSKAERERKQKVAERKQAIAGFRELLAELQEAGELQPSSTMATVAASKGERMHPRLPHPRVGSGRHRLFQLQLSNAVVNRHVGSDDREPVSTVDAHACRSGQEVFGTGAERP